MSDLTITADDVAIVKSVEQLTGPCAEDIDAGEAVRIDSNGYFTLGNASSASEGDIVGIAANSGVEGQTITALKRGLLGLGDGLSSVAFNTQIKLSDTDGALDDGAGSPTADYIVGKVVPLWASVSGDKILMVDISA